MTVTHLKDIHDIAVAAAAYGWAEAQRYSRTAPNTSDIAYEKGPHRLDLHFLDGRLQVAQHTGPGVDTHIDTRAGVHAVLKGA